MNPNSISPDSPQNQPLQFTEEALNKKFSYSFTRKQLIVLVNVLRPIQLPISDVRSRVLIEVLDEIERTAIQSITPDDYKKPENESTTDEVAVN